MADEDLKEMLKDVRLKLMIKGVPYNYIARYFIDKMQLAFDDST